MCGAVRWTIGPSGDRWELVELVVVVLSGDGLGERRKVGSCLPRSPESPDLVHSPSPLLSWTV